MYVAFATKNSERKKESNEKTKVAYIKEALGKHFQRSI